MKIVNSLVTILLPSLCLEVKHYKTNRVAAPEHASRVPIHKEEGKGDGVDGAGQKVDEALNRTNR